MADLTKSTHTIFGVFVMHTHVTSLNITIAVVTFPLMSCSVSLIPQQYLRSFGRYLFYIKTDKKACFSG